jgi:cyclase
MSLARRIIPVMLTADGNLVKGKQFNSQRVVGNVMQAAEIYQMRKVDELVILDVTATAKGCGPDVETIKALTEKCFMPIAAGGGVTCLEHVRELLANGADKVVIGTAAFNTVSLIRDAAKKFGSQAVVVAVDAIYDPNCSNWFLTTNCGDITHFYSPVQFAKDMEMYGAGELIVTNVMNDGMMQGYDLGLIRKIAKAVSIPVIANGGCGNYDHMHRALKAGASAVAAGAMFQWEDATPREAAEYLQGKGWEVRV